MTLSRRSLWRSGVLAVVVAASLSIKTQAEMHFEVRPLGGTNSVGSAEQGSNEIQAVKEALPEIQTKRAQQQRSSTNLRRRIEGLLIPEVSVREASVMDVIDFLRGQGQTLSVDKTPINVIWEAPEETKTAKVTLSLREVPLADALTYVTESVGLRYRVDAYAIVIYIPPPTTPPHAKP
jgi:hypothetical protein